MAIRITAFSGISPRTQPRLLAENMAQIVNNCRLGSGALEPWKKITAVTANDLADGDVLSIFRMEDGGTSYWLSWDRDVNCVPSLIAGDEAQRIYYTGDGEPRVSNLALAIAGGSVMPAGFYVLGVVAPLVAPTVAPTGGSGAADSRAYIETFVTEWGEEGAPSPASAITVGKVDDTWALTSLNAVPINTAAISAATHYGGVVTATTASTKYLRAGEEVTIADVVGMTDLNSIFPILSVVDATHFTVALTTAQTYTSGGSWTRVAAHNISGMTRRIYRTSGGVYRFVAEIAIATTSYDDTVAEVDLGEICPSIGWKMPPTGLTGLVSHPMGFLVGVVGNEICLSDPWHPHAWPIAYRQITKFPLVGLGVFSSSIVACTTGTPYILNGSHPDSISIEQTELVEPCIAKRTIVDVGSGIMYASHSGMVFVGVGGANVVTQSILSRANWQEYTPSAMACAFYDGMVIGFPSSVVYGGKGGFILDSKNNTFSSLSVVASASYADPENGKLYMVSNGVLTEWDSDKINNETYEWRSKVFALPKPINAGWAKIDADFKFLNADQTAQIAAHLAADTAFNTAILASGVTDGELDSAMLDEYMLDGSLLVGGEITDYAQRFLNFMLYANGQQKYTEIVLNDQAFSLPSGYKSALYEVVISGNVTVYGVSIAETAVGLSAV